MSLAEELDQTITKGQVIELIGLISAELAARSGAWDGKAPDWFPQPPEWLELVEDYLPQVEGPAAREEVESLEFRAIWEAIKGWDLEREPGAGYAGATGTDVLAIQNSLARFRGTEPVEDIPAEDAEEISVLLSPGLRQEIGEPIDPDAVDKDCGCP
jgi:hypothetical protein